MAFELSQKQGEATYWLDSNKSKIEWVLYGGAAGGGKTQLGCAWQIERRAKYPKSKGIIGRKHLTDLKKSTLETYDRIIFDHTRHLGLKSKLNGQLNIIEFNNGSRIFLADTAASPGDPMFTNFGGWEASDAFIDEAGESPEMAINTIFSRCRFNLINNKPAILLASNPAVGWLKNNWIKDKQGKPITLPSERIYIKAMLDDNPDKAFSERYRKTLEQMPKSQRDRLLLGDWDYISNDTPYYNDFSESNIIESYTPDKGFPLTISFDFNYDPCSLVIQQFIPQTGIGLITFHEIQHTGGTRPLAEKLKAWIQLNWSGPFRITGDASGHKKDTRSGSKTDFDIIQEVLQIPSGWIEYNNRRNESLGWSRDMMNALFYHKLHKITRNCSGLIADITGAKPKGDTGEFIKDRENNKLDLLDADRYGVHLHFKDYNDILLLKA